MSDDPLDPDDWVADHGDALYRYALSRVGRADAAEDLVQETLLAALKAVATFAARSAVRTWLIGILRHKLIDRLRSQREAAVADLRAPDDWLDGLYDKGHWRQAPGRWGDDGLGSLQRGEFWAAFEECRARLPERLRLVLSLRLLDDLPAPEVCGLLNISAANLWTMLHRARMRLWKCLDQKGLAPGGGAS